MSLSIKVLKCVFRTDRQRGTKTPSHCEVFSIVGALRAEWQQASIVESRTAVTEAWKSFIMSNRKQPRLAGGWHLYVLSPHPQFMMIGHRGLMMYYEYLTLLQRSPTSKIFSKAKNLLHLQTEPSNFCMKCPSHPNVWITKFEGSCDGLRVKYPTKRLVTWRTTTMLSTLQKQNYTTGPRPLHWRSCR